MLWGKFAGAQTSLDAAAKRTDLPRYWQGACAIASVLMKDSQRFYVPKGVVSPVAGKPLDDSIRKYAKLPYPSIALLHETILVGREGEEAGWKITIACEPAQLWSSFNFGVPQTYLENKIILFSLLWSNAYSQGLWVPVPVFALVAHRAGGIGYDIHLFNTSEGGDAFVAQYQEMAIKESGQDIRYEYAEEMVSVIDLCLLLNVRGTEKVAVQAPPKLNKKRARSNKVLFSDYHVLRVGGETWDHVVSTAGGSGVRSHYRRGHIRHIAGDRPIWVRHTTVHGSKPGFVGKDYQL